MKKFLIAALSLLIPCISQARIGETESEIAIRYGQPESSEPGFSNRDIRNTYTSHGCEIIVHFLDGKSSAEHFIKIDGSAFSGTELATLLAANDPGKWEQLISPICKNGYPVPEREGFMDWKFGNTLTATYTIQTHAFQVSSLFYNKWFSEMKKASEQKNLSGF